MTLAAKLEDIRHFALQEGEAKCRAEGRAAGERDTKNSVVKQLLRRKQPLEKIADICALELTEVKK